MIEAAFRIPDVPTLSNNEIGRLLGVHVSSVRSVRRKLESVGVIPRVNLRLSRHGNFVNVVRVCEPPWRTAIAPDRD